MKETLKSITSGIGIAVLSSLLCITLIGITLEFNGVEVKDVVISLFNFSKESSEQLSTTEVASTTESSTNEDSGVRVYYPPVTNNEYYNITVETTDGEKGGSGIIKGNSSSTVTISSTTEESAKTTKEDKKTKDDAKKGKKQKSENNGSATVTESTKDKGSVVTTEANEPLEFAEGNDASQIRKMSCNVKVDTPGQIVVLSDDKDEQSGDVYISYSSDASGNAISNPNIVEYSVNDLVNQSSLINNQEIKYINVMPGVYTFNFANCQFENVEVCVLDDINALFNNELQDEINGEVEEYNIDVPSQDNIKVTISEQASICKMNVFPQTDFVPNFIFYSDNNLDGTMRVLDEEGNELQLIELYGTVDDSKQIVGGNFTFETGKQYYIEITSSSNIILSEYVYHFQVME